jgi:hypothetical protein
MANIRHKSQTLLFLRLLVVGLLQQAQGRSCGICGEHSSTGIYFCVSALVFFSQYHSINAPY